ncbi:MFS transporter [Marinomonas mediterranea]|jgi:Arabinose efflux permease|uniref:Major facilitator superfamily MFS_1 n=1 Tax=Marinomonas mediterranea (strain ATCC 700492 / JCM 21426 / NBRC 103028 / MMB-1) TaxID=717774 RepID=F2K4W2_MARM1|nr:MFS transporter [Marinomonas mediterranea]ADZ92605.1 major facilitator superfamily MFS_1 [Marinomonas mediterranea MMB-1]WCN10546.1 MFS transporter [Marinomonas mediterranea]WCN18643.1 MFS transporter [Marinomonas mediterranea MMB-1]
MFGINVWGLALGQALLITGNILLISVTALVGQHLAPELGYATLPIALQYIGLMFVTLPAAHVMKWVGRKKGFLIGNVLGVVGACLAYMALSVDNFYIFCCGTFMLGMSIGVSQQYRYAAAEHAPSNKIPQAIGLIMGAGVIAAILGPNLAIWFENWIPDIQYQGAFLALIVVYLITMVLIQTLPLKKPTIEEQKGPTRSYRELLKQNDLVGAIVAGAIGYGVMVLIMTATPLAMMHAGHDFSHTASTIQWHVLGMFAPSFFTGKLISKFGCSKVIQTGCLMLVACIALTQFGATYWHFSIALAFLGIGWNFTFIGATSLLTGTYRPAEKAKVQGLNDLVVFSCSAVASLLAGYWQNLLGWELLNLMMVPLIFCAMITIAAIRKRAELYTEPS